MTPRCEDDLNDTQFEANMELLEVQVVRYVRTMGERLHLSEQTQGACMKRAMMDALLDMIEHEPCDLARGEIVEDLSALWNRRVGAMLKQRIAGPTAH